MSNGVSSIARDNLKKGLGSPVAKVAIVVLVALIIISIAVGVRLMSGGGRTSGAAKADSYGTPAQAPRGETDKATAKAVAEDSDRQATEARQRGQSFAGPFVFEPSIQSGAGQGGNAPNDGFSEKVSDQSPRVLAALRSRAAEYDSAEDRSGGRASGQGGSTAAAGAGQGAANGAYGMSEDGFKQVTDQLRSVGMTTMRYESLPNGSLARSATGAATAAPAAPGAASNAAGGSAMGAPQMAAPPVVAAAAPGISSGTPGERVALRAGTICPGVPESAVNTDFAVPVFIKLLECGMLTGARVKGTVVKTPSDFTLRFTNLFLDPGKGYKVNGTVEAVSINVKKEGEPGIADDVNNHWFTRLGSSALLALAKTEKQFITARGSTTVTTGTSSSTTIEPLSDEEKKTARAAGVLEGAMEVVSRDLGTGINRQPTMTLDKGTVIGVQFMDDVKVVPQ